MSESRAAQTPSRPLVVSIPGTTRQHGSIRPPVNPSQTLS